MANKFEDQSDQIQKFTESLLNSNAKAIEEMQTSLSKKEMEYLDYFWNQKSKEIRNSLPLLVIVFFESETSHDSILSLIESRVTTDIKSLERKGYLENKTQGVYKLSAKGVSFIKDKHPKLIVIWERFFEKTPKLLSLIITAVGLIGSIFGIIQYFGG